MLKYQRPKGTTSYKEVQILKDGKLFGRVWTYKHTKSWYGKIEGGKTFLKFDHKVKLLNLNEALRVISEVADMDLPDSKK